MACVSRAVRPQGRPRALRPTASSAMPALRMPARVAAPRRVTQGETLRVRAAPIRTPLCAPGGVGGVARDGAKPAQGTSGALADGHQRLMAMGQGATGTYRGGSPRFCVIFNSIRGNAPRPRWHPTRQRGFGIKRTSGKSLQKKVTNYILPENLLDIDIIITMYRKITKTASTF
jgi:hypothetical protein